MIISFEKEYLRDLYETGKKKRNRVKKLEKQKHEH